MRTWSDQATSRSRTGMADRPAGADEAALAEYYRHERVKLHAFASRLTSDRDAAEDIVQQAFAKTITAIRDGTEIADLSHWLHRVVRNLSANERRRSVMPHQPLQEDLCADPGPDPHVAAELRDRYEVIHGTLDAIPQRQRAALLLTAVRGLSQEETASALGTTVDSVRQSVFRARRAMRAAVDSGRETFGAVVLGLLPGSGNSDARKLLSRARNAVAVRLGGGVRDASTGPLDRLLHAAAQPATSLVAAAIAVSPILVMNGPPGSGAGPGDPTQAVFRASPVAGWLSSDEVLVRVTGALPPGGAPSKAGALPTEVAESPRPKRPGGPGKKPPESPPNTGGVVDPGGGGEAGPLGEPGEEQLSEEPTPAPTQTTGPAPITQAPEGDGETDPTPKDGPWSVPTGGGPTPVVPPPESGPAPTGESGPTPTPVAPEPESGPAPTP